MTTRLTQLLQFVNDDPSDPFNHYALALEFQKTDVLQAIRIFESLVEQHPDYVPTYYHLGKLFQDSGQHEKALSTFDQGIEAAQKMNDPKAFRELNSAKRELQDENIY